MRASFRRLSARIYSGMAVGIDPGFVLNVASTVGTRAFLVVLSMVTSIIVARALGPAGRGDFAVAVTVAAIATQVGLLGLNNANTWAVARERGRLGHLLGNSLAVSLFVGSAIALVVITVGMVVAVPELIPADLLVLAMVGVPFGIAALLLLSLAIGIGQPRLYNGLLITQRGSAAIVTVGLVLLGLASAVSLYAAVMAGSMFVVLIGAITLARRSGAGRGIDLPTLRSLYRYGRNAYLSNLLMFVLLWADIVIVQLLLGPGPTGQYAVAVSILEALRMIPAAIGAWLLARLSAERDHRHRDRETRSVAWATAAIMTIAAVVMAVVAPWVIPLLYGEAFAASVAPFVLLLPGFVFLSVRSVLWARMGAEGMPRVVITATLAGLLLNVALNLVLVPAYGIEGAALSSSVAYGAILLVGLVRVRREAPPVLSDEGKTTLSADAADRTRGGPA